LVVVDCARSGIGLAAAKILALMNPNHRIVLVARTLEKARFAMEQVAQVLLPLPTAYEDNEDDENLQQQHEQQPLTRRGHNLIALACDHCRLDSVREFCEQLKSVLQDTYRPELWTHQGIDALCLNAAVLLPEAASSQPSFTQDGIETTFQTNHVAPFLMLNLLYESMNPNGRVVFTTSGLHLQCNTLDVSGAYDAATKQVRRNFEMLDGSAYHYKRAYTISKLCNVATCHELHQRQHQQPTQRPGGGGSSKGVVPICFSPGLMLGSGLFRHQDLKVVQQHVATAKCMPQAKTVEWGAGALVYVAVSDRAGQLPNVYWSDESFMGCAAVYGKEFRPNPLTAAVMEDDRRKQLWDLSLQLAKLLPEEELFRP
jgi:NAD(P)-dependent dehydrogenase (short-subunit alcohol dehydrogenase family)